MPEAGFRTYIVVFSQSERFPVLLDEAGLPHWFSTLFTVAQKRNANKAPIPGSALRVQCGFFSCGRRDNPSISNNALHVA
ncbi:MAG: hypothetical protein ACREPQ_11915 [Rhodanobacter sp.]